MAIIYGMPTLVELPDLESCASLAHELGLGFVEVNMSFPQYQLDMPDMGRLTELKEKYDIFFTIHADENTDPCSINPRIAEVYTDTILRTAELAAKEDIPVINMHLLRGVYVTLPERRTYVYAENEERYMADMCRFRDRVQAAVGDSGVKLCVENTDGFDLRFLSRGVDTLLESAAFALTIDIGHDNAIDNRDLPFILARRDRLTHMHMHDSAGQRVHLALGDGNADIGWYCALAESTGCRVVLETKTVAALKQSVEYLRRNGYK